MFGYIVGTTYLYGINLIKQIQIMNVDQIHAEINAAIACIAEKHGLVYPPNTLRYSDTQITVKIQMVKPTESVKSDVDMINTGHGQVGDIAFVNYAGRRQQVLITKRTGRGHYHFQMEDGRIMSAHYSLLFQQ